MKEIETAVYFNPACTNCNTVRGILEGLGVDADYVHYLDKAPTTDEIEQVLKALGTDDPREIVRTKEPVYDELGLDGAGRDQLIEAMAAHPILIQRPIVIRGDKAVVGRPPELVSALFEAN